MNRHQIFISLGLIIQVIKGYTRFNIPVYLAACYGLSLPLFVEMVMFAFTVHVLINNKFAAHAVGLGIWTIMFFANNTRDFNYKLLLYGFIPGYTFSDMDGVGPSIAPLVWFNVYWLFCGGLLLVLAAIFYYRGIITSFRERVLLARHRFRSKIRLITVVFLVGFFATGLFNYYNVSYLNVWLINKEKDERAVAFEKELKKYSSDPLPAIIELKLFTDIFPEERKATTHAYVTILNKTNLPITRLLMDGDQLSSYSIKYHGQLISFTYSLIYPRAKFSLFRSDRDTSMYRVYHLPGILKPGDTTTLELNSTIGSEGFSNNFSGLAVIHNGSAFDGGLPGIGYDDDEELESGFKRKEYHLPEKNEELISQSDSAGMSHLNESDLPGGRFQFDATISTSGDQIAVTQGTLENKWRQNGRNYYHYVQKTPGYPPVSIVSARYSTWYDSITLENGKRIGIELYYHPGNAANLERFINGYKDGLRYFSKHYGNFQYDRIRHVESSIYTNDMVSFQGMQAFSERWAWNASFDKPGQFDYVYFYSVFQLGHQWWMYQVAPNHTIGSNTIADGLAKYGAFLLYEKKVGIENMKDFMRGESEWYLTNHRYAFERENPLLYSKRYWVWDTKAATLMFGLKDLMGEDSLNAALREFHDMYAFKNDAPFAGANDLYRVIKKHVPDSLQYYLTDSWERITIYDNKIVDAFITPTVNKNEYNVHIKLSIGKTYTDRAGNDEKVPVMNDFIDLGIFEGDQKLYFKKSKFSAGEHQLDIIVKGKPTYVGIDPYFKLIDAQSNDNFKYF